MTRYQRLFRRHKSAPRGQRERTWRHLRDEATRLLKADLRRIKRAKKQPELGL